ncbi:MAG: sugar phosphate nucleotidyltransferase [Candidatus Pacebacteria bacterium]|nr:sugar phosphate nucleotidyltransferase [Candidatus Paceibacterota bacterium]
MKGIILAGGKGTRLYPCTRVTNKHLLPVYDQPMIYYPLKLLINAGIKDILIISGEGHAGDFLELLKDGREFGAKISYSVQMEAGGIAQALGLAEDFADKEKVVVILGDNIFENDLSLYVKSFENQEKGARLFLKEVNDANRFGVAEVKDERIVGIEEKPKAPKSNLAVTGLYMYDGSVFDVIKTLRPSDRGELEITDVNNYYINNSITNYDILDGFWSDAGTFESLFRTSEFMKSKK